MPTEAPDLRPGLLFGAKPLAQPVSFDFSGPKFVKESGFKRARRGQKGERVMVDLSSRASADAPTFAIR
jgi:hypothetical protein